MEQKSEGQFRNQLRVRKDEKEESSGEVGGREFGQVIEPMQSQMASGNEGLTDKGVGQEKPAPDNNKKSAA